MLKAHRKFLDAAKAEIRGGKYPNGPQQEHSCPECGSTKTYPAATNFRCENHHLFPWTGRQ